eukprot:CAMPEP_0203661590 /NCGR_PEP_ID=MMETSP0088-20131115/59689_1 /ASSEMBLY_ACC=CAM_ASM_001087 /TAXON_ID=426623 /ORGANISM="Chaetoceros affinis, Strain CCMP159" /LENGTH=660 /DNA_ID=CAMNT_0050524269 /DNA_START=13 /DNA_END=1995 /DNA_ORIENTATION=+
MAAKPKPKPKPKPAPRPVLQFDSEDDLSFGDDSEEDEEIDLGGGKKEDEKDEKNITAKEENDKQKDEDEEEKKEVDDVLSGVAAAAITGDFEKVVVPAPQDDLSREVHGGNDDADAGDVVDNYDVVETTEENNGDDSIEIVLHKERSVVPEEDGNNDENNGLDEDFSIDTASIDDILGKTEDENEEKVEQEDSQKDIAKDVSDYDDEDPRESLNEVDGEYINHYNDAPENDTLTVSDQEDEDNFTDEAEEPYQAEADDLIDLESVGGDEAVDEVIHDSEKQGEDANEDDFVEHDELDDLLNKEQEAGEPDEPNEPVEDENNDEENDKVAPNTLIESDDDISMGEDSIVDEETPEETTHKSSAEQELEPAETVQQELPEEPQEEPQEELPEVESQEQQLPDQDSLHEMEFENKEQMKKSNTLDSLDFILDASSTIAEEPEEEEEEEEEGQAEEEEELSLFDDDESFKEEEEEGQAEEEEELSLFDDDESFMEDDRSDFEDEEEDELIEESDFEGDDEPDMEDEPNEELPPLRYKLLISDKYHPEYGLEELYPEDLYLVDSLTAFEEGAISNQELAVLIIEALFERDFEHGEHWEIDNGTARDLEEDEGGGGDLEGCAFVVKRQARLDWNDLYSVAAAKGTIIISSEKDEIKVENYSYFVAG